MVNFGSFGEMSRRYFDAYFRSPAVRSARYLLMANRIAAVQLGLDVRADVHPVDPDVDDLAGDVDFLELDPAHDDVPEVDIAEHRSGEVGGAERAVPQVDPFEPRPAEILVAVLGHENRR